MTATITEIGLADIVLFEDDVHERLALTSSLEERGFFVHIAASVDDVLRLHAEGYRNFIIDGKHDGDEGAGPEALRRLRQIDSRCFIAFVTGIPSSYPNEWLTASLFAPKTGSSSGLADKIVQSMRPTNSERDINHEKFLQLLEDAAWVEEFYGQYIGISQGAIQIIDPNPNKVIKLLDSLPEELPKYYARIEKDPPAVRVLTPFRRL